MLNPIKISESLLTKYLEAVGDLMCSPSPAVVEELAKAKDYFKAPPINKGEAYIIVFTTARWLCPSFGFRSLQDTAASAAFCEQQSMAVACKSCLWQLTK
jgi:hypothetical protein